MLPTSRRNLHFDGLRAGRNWLTVGASLLLAAAVAAQEPPPARALTKMADRAVSPARSAAASAVAASEPRRVALVIGNSRYTALPVLKNAVNDATDLCEALGQLRFQVFCRIDVADRAAFRAALRQFSAQLGPDTMALFYFAGHGMQLRGDNFLLPVQVPMGSQLDMEEDSLALSHVMRVLEEARSAPNLIILDACRDDPFAGQAGAPKVARGLARVDPPVGSLLVYATAPGAVAMDGIGRNGLFTKHLLAHLKHPSVPLSELMQQVASDVEKEAREVHRTRQVPYRSFSYSGTLCLADCDDSRASAQLAELKRRSEETAERMRQLEAENARLASTTANPANTADMADRQATSRRDSEARGTDLSELKQMLLDYQKRIQSLEADPADKGRAPAKAPPPETKPRPVVVPTF